MADSIPKRIQDYLMARLAGDAETPFPTGLAVPKINKNRGTPVGKDELPMFSVYFVHDTPVTQGGNKYRPALLQRSMIIEVRLIVPGTDDATDPYRIWVVNRMSTADRMVVNGEQLALGILEGETPFEPLQGSVAESTTTHIRWTVDYKTNPQDLTKTA